MLPALLRPDLLLAAAALGAFGVGVVRSYHLAAAKLHQWDANPDRWWVVPAIVAGCILVVLFCRIVNHLLRKRDRRNETAAGQG
jgi:hypothetical protein